METVLIETPGRPPRVVHRDAPAPGEGRVAVRVAAAPITPLDRLCATGTSYFGRPALPYVPGVQGVGTLDGAPVWFATSAGMAPGDGSMRAVADVAEADVVALPDGADPVLVAALGLSAVAAWCAMTATGGLVPGETVLVLGAGGVVGQAAVQLARRAGAARVVAAARSAQAREHALTLGADAAVALPDTPRTAAPGAHPPGPGAAPPDLAERLREACDGAADLVLDPLCGPAAAAALQTLRPRGRLVNLGSAAAPSMPVDSALLRSAELRVLGYTNNMITSGQRRDALAVVAAEIVAGRLTATHQAVPLADAAQAWTREGPRVVLVPGGNP